MKPDKTNWITSSHDEMNDKIRVILGGSPVYVRFSIFETVQDGVQSDLSDWIVRHPDFGSMFAKGKVQFDLGDDENGHAVLSKVYIDPTWKDILIEAERSCIGRGAPELDHIFLEGLEESGVGADGAVFWSFVWGS